MRKKEFCKECKSHLPEKDKINCNKCGETCYVYGPGPIVELCGLINAEVWGGYLNKYLQDEIIYRFDLCEKCLKELFDLFKIPVEKCEYDPHTMREIIDKYNEGNCR